MTKRIVYFIGVPGSGKTTLMREVMAPFYGIQHAKPFAHIEYQHPTERVVQVGKERGTFSGTDALSMGVQPKVVEWLKTCDYDTILAEGDRLATDSFFHAASEVGGLMLFVLACSEATAQERRAARGSNQNETWLKGRVTKVQRLAERWPHVVVSEGDPNNARMIRDILGEGWRQYDA